LRQGWKCDLDIRQSRRSAGWAPAGMSASIRARRPAFDKEGLLGGARFVFLLSAQRLTERELMFLRALAS
jgi:hypothetical protein